MAVYVSNIVIEQGFTFETTFQLEDTRTNSFLNLSGYEIKSKLRKSHDSRNYVSFASSIIQPKFGRISIGLQSGETLLLKPGRYVYDVKIISGGNQYKAVEGSALVRAGVTK